MANRTVKDAKVVHGTNPQYLVEKIIRTRIYESRYWKEECFGLNAADVLEKGSQLRFIGGIYGGNIKPSPFLCLTLKMLQIQPEKEIIIQFIGRYGERYKYLRAIGAFYLRLTGTSLENWKYLEPLYNDFRKLRIMDRMGNFSVIHVDEYIDMLLREERVFDVILPRISKRRVHEESDQLEPRVSLLEHDLNLSDEDSEDSDRDMPHKKKEDKKPEPKSDRRSRKEDKEKTGDGDHQKSHHKKDREKSPKPGYDESREHRHHHKKRDVDYKRGEKRRDRSRDRDRRRDERTSERSRGEYRHKDRDT